MAGKEKENKKRKGKQRLVGEMAIRWIAVVRKATKEKQPKEGRKEDDLVL